MLIKNSQLPPLPKKPANLVPLWLCLLLILIGLVIVHLEISFETLFWGFSDILEYLGRYTSPNFSAISKYLELMGQTLAIALWGTALAFSISLFLTPLAAKNISPYPVLYRIVRELLIFLLALPDLILALIFVAALGLGPLPGVLALGFHTAGFLSKFFSESMERVEPGVYEAINATGANFLQLVMFAAWPSIIQEVVGYTLYIFDRNVRVATVLGLVGAGGIGLELNANLRFFQYDQAAAIIIIILITIVTIDYLSGFLRRKLS
ncbi:phosphonate ABC transporter, permease protein PhnE [Iningainema tapete]|uniref:Phosphonate ABC transporter, permease protein PhnE n=1 Tax=Iningainema tapete BLCC-T55 TaxID=2748662 RepID=A0A8J7C581_9CYAN|nr:phosphonate ABC transporter, permease protein PhnE [Iningainema tapete]MBD2772709.1 phosphonate ABC transporter, permease protein PhnE [Iningainema tapete BLCC-T55]